MDDTLLDWDNIADAHCSPAESISSFSARIQARLEFPENEVNEAFAKVGNKIDHYAFKHRRRWCVHDQSDFWKAMQEYDNRKLSEEQRKKIDERISAALAASSLAPTKKCMWVHVFLGLISLHVSELNPIKDEESLEGVGMDVSKANFDKAVEQVFFASAIFAEASDSERDIWTMIERCGIIQVWRAANQIIAVIYQAAWEAVRTQSVRQATADEVLAKTMLQVIRLCERKMVENHGVGAAQLKAGKEDFRLIRACLKEGNLKREMSSIKKYTQTFRISTSMRWHESNTNHKTIIPKRALCTLRFHLRTRISKNMRN